MQFYDYNWKKIGKYLKKHKSAINTKRKFGLSEWYFRRAVKEGLIKLPKRWDCVKYVNAGNHPAKGVSCEIRDFLLDPKSEDYTYREIAKKFKCSGVNIVYHAHALELANRKNHPPEYYERNWKIVQKYLDKTKSFAATGRKFGLSAAVIKRRTETGELTRPEGVGAPENRPKRYKKRK